MSHSAQQVAQIVSNYRHIRREEHRPLCRAARDLAPRAILLIDGVFRAVLPRDAHSEVAFYVLVLAASFIAVGRRGMLTVR